MTWNRVIFDSNLGCYVFNTQLRNLWLLVRLGFWLFFNMFIFYATALGNTVKAESRIRLIHFSYFFQSSLQEKDTHGQLSFFSFLIWFHLSQWVSSAIHYLYGSPLMLVQNGRLLFSWFLPRCMVSDYLGHVLFSWIYTPKYTVFQDKICI